MLHSNAQQSLYKRQSKIFRDLTAWNPSPILPLWIQAKSVNTLTWLLTYLKTYILSTARVTAPIPLVARSKAWVCGRSFAWIAASNPGGIVVWLWVLCTVKLRSLRRDGHSSRGALPSVVCLTLCDRETARQPRPIRAVEPWGGEKIGYTVVW